LTKRIIKYNPRLKALAKELRNNSTLTEVLLWQHLNKKQMAGVRFHRQKPIDEFIVDFYAPDLGLVMEIDGNSHKFKGSGDFDRQEILTSLGLHILRFTDKEVKQSIEVVLTCIREWIDDQIR
jgi:very-short-patch-repair endonuclease